MNHANPNRSAELARNVAVALRFKKSQGTPEMPQVEKEVLAPNYDRVRSGRRFFRRPDPRKQEWLCNGAEGCVRPTLARLGSACVEVRQLGSIQGANRVWGIFARDRVTEFLSGRRYRRGSGKRWFEIPIRALSTAQEGRIKLGRTQFGPSDSKASL